MEASLQADAIMPFPTLTSFLIKCFFFMHQPQYFAPNIQCLLAVPFALDCPAFCQPQLPAPTSAGQKHKETLIEKLGHVPKTEGPVPLAHPAGATNPVFQYPGYGQNLIYWNLT